MSFKKSFIKNLAMGTALIAISATLFSGCSKNTEELKIYSIIHEEETQALTDLFTKKTGIPVSFLRASTGELVNRVIVEKDDPQADILLGGATSYHMQADSAGALESYDSPMAKNVPEYARSENNTWTGFCVLTLGIGVNTARFQQKFPSEKIPATWDDLLNPAFKGEIVLTNPVASSTAYLFVQDQLQRLGWDDGWTYLRSLSELVGQFPDSGSAPAKLVGTGEYTFGVSYLHALSKYNAGGFNITLVAPPKSVGDVDCISILKNSKNQSAARKFVDFMLSKDAQELMSSIDFTIPVNPDATAVKGSIPVSELDLIDYDANLASTQKDEVLKKWAKEIK